MVLIDSSVWIRFIRDREPTATELQTLLNREEAVGHDLVYGELLIGDCGGRNELLKSYRRMPRVPGIPNEHVVEFVRAYKLHGRGIGWFDAHLLGSALVAHVSFWSTDERLASVAQRFGIAYHPDRA